MFRLLPVLVILVVSAAGVGVWLHLGLTREVDAAAVLAKHGLPPADAAQASTFVPAGGLSPPGGLTSPAMSVDCDVARAGVQSDCTYLRGTKFAIQVHVTEPPAENYFGFQAKVRWPESVLNYQPSPDPADEALWGPCSIPARLDNRPADPSLVFACVPFPPLPQGDSSTGAVLEFEFQCGGAAPQAGLSPPGLALVPRQGDLQLGTYFLNAIGDPIDPVLAAASVTCVDGALAVDCDADTPAIDTECTYDVGSTFPVAVHVEEPPLDGYFGFQAKVRWSKGTLNYLPSLDPADEALWSNCAIPARLDNWPADPSLVFACIPFPPLTQGDVVTGAVLRFDFQCKTELGPPGPLSPPLDLSAPSDLSLISRQGDLQLGSHFLNSKGAAIDPALSPATVTCSALDRDRDGCTNAQEEGDDPRIGGGRDPDNYWDFYDVPESADPGDKDKVVSAGDLLRLVRRFGSVGTPGDPLSGPVPGAPGYHASFDRSAVPGKMAGPADGTIIVEDIFLAVAQFGHSCL